MKQFYRFNLKAFLVLIFSLLFITIASAQVPNCATSPFPANGATLTRMATFSWTAPTGPAVTGYKVFIGTTTAANEILSPTAANTTTNSYNYRFQANAGGLMPGVTYYWKVVPVNGSGDATGCSVQSFTITAAGDPTVFPVNTWNAYCYNSNAFTNYVGYYTETPSANGGFDSRTSWTSNDQAPSNTTASSAAGGGGAATYLGGAMSYDNHSVSYKRQGFTPGYYTIDIIFDDNCWIYLNGTLVYSRNGYTTAYLTSVATVYLDATSQFEFRWSEGGGGSNGHVKFNSGATPPTLVAGAIAGDQFLCSGGSTDPAAFTSTTAPSGGCGATINYQWQSDVNCTGTFTNIAGATSATYDAPAGVTQTTCYRRLAVDNICNRNIPSNTITVTVGTTPGTPSVFPVNSWNGYVYGFASYSSADAGWTDYRGYFSYTGPDPSFNTNSIYTTANLPSSAAGYLGCAITANLSGVQLKRKGFPTGTYSIDFSSDDAGYLYVNGVLVYSKTAGGTGSATAVWVGNLDANSTIELRYKNNNGTALGALTFNVVTAPTLVAGVIAGNQSLCSAVSTDPAAFTSTTPASGTCVSTVSYQWQSDANCTGTFTDISGATNAVYDAPAGVTQTTCYRRLVVDANCNRTLASNTITVTVYSTAPGDPTVFPANSWNGYVYGFASYNAADAGWTDYRGYFSYAGADPSFNTTSIYTTANVPSSAPGFLGCPVTANLSGIQMKRQGFPTGTYSIDFGSDDAGYLYINGVLVYSRGTNGSATNVWTGNLGATSTVELRYKNNTGTGFGSVTFNVVPTPTLIPGTIAGNQILCPGNDPYAFTSTVAASGTCSAVAYQWQSDVNCTGTFTDISGATNAVYDVPAGITQTTCYRRAVIDANCGRTDYTNTLTVTVTTVPQGDPTVFPLNSWNAYVYDFTTPGYTTADNNWTDYKGFYSINTVSFNTNTIYAGSGNNPPSIAAGYAGCQLASAPLTGAQIKRQGFPTGIYQIDFTSDDAGFLYINGNLVYSRTGNGTQTNVWTGTLDASSTIDFRYKNNGGPGSGALTFTIVTPTIPLTEGGIALNGPSTICPGNTVTPIISTSDAASSCYWTYQWQAADSMGYIDIPGATAASYTPASIGVSTSYRRYVKDACGDDAYSNVVNITVGPSTPPDPTIFGNNSWIAYVYNQSNYVPASLFGSYTDPGVSSTDPSFNSLNSWAASSAPSMAATYTGCQVGVDYHSVIYKRQGFPAGTYKLNVLNDDACQLYIDGVLVYSSNNYTPTFINGIWTGVLGASSKIEFRWTEGGGSSDGALTFILITPPGPLNGGTISNATTQVCSGDVPTAFTSTALPSNGCAVAAYQWQLDNGSGYTDISGATSVTYTPVAQTTSTSYRRKVTDACAQVAYSNVIVINVATPTPPNPSVFGSNVWNVYAYNDVNFTLLRGSYVDNGLSASDPSFDSRNKWVVAGTPSNASGYTGCSVNIDQHGVIYKRQGFPSGIYRLDYNSDDAGSVYVNGVLVYTSVSYGTLVTNIWSGPLDGTSTIEYRWADTGGGSSYGQLVMVHPITPAVLVPGTIANSTTIVCSGDTPAPFTSTANATGGCYKTYQWELSTTSTSSGYSDISGATATTYTPTAGITATTYYRRKVTGACGSTAYSNVVTITVGVPSPPTLTWGNGQWNAYVYNGRNFTTLYGSYVENNISSSNYSFDSRNSWITTSRPSTASTYSGCQVGDNTFSVSYRQTNFVPGTYQIDIEADDDAVLIINGVTQYTGTGICCTPKINVWTGTLNASSQVEIRYGENNGNAYCKTTITSSTPPALVPGTIGTDQTICSNVVPAALTSVANATSGCAITYQWQYSTTSATGPWTNLGGATATTSAFTPNPPGLTQTTYYIRTATDACGRTASSNVVTVTVDSKPNNAGTMTGLASVCSGQAGVTYSINPVTYATSYTWVLPAGATITSGAGTNSITVTFGSASGDVTVQPTNNCGVGLTSTISVTVAPSIPAAASAISGSTSVCQAQYNELYSVPAVAYASSYIWTLPTGATFVSGSTTNAPRITFGAVGGTISVTPTNGCGNALTTKNLTVNMTPTPNAAGAITGTGTVCPGQTGVTYSIAAVTNATTYNWSLPAGASITSGAGTRSIVVTFGSTSGNVTVTPTNACGTGAAKTLVVSVVSLGSTGAISGLSPVCQNSTGIIYTVPVVTGASTYTWTVPPGATITSGNGTRTIYVTMGTTSGNITVTPSNSCATGTASSRAISVTNTVPTAATSIVGNTNPCQAQSMTYSTTSTGATSYAWTLPTGTVITTGTNTNTITATIGANSGNIIVTPSNVCGNATSASQAITVSALPTASAGGTQTICVTGTATVSGASSNNGTIAWTHNGTGSLANTTTLTPTYTPGAGDAGNAVTLTMTVSNSPCAAVTATYTVNVKAIPTASAGGSQTICRNSTATVSGATSSNGTILWTHNGTGSLTGAATLTPTYTPTGGDNGNTVTLTMTVSNSPCTAATATYAVSVQGIPSATAGGSQTICANSTATVSGASSNNGTIVWTHNGTGTLANATTLTPTYTPGSGDAGNSVILTMTVSNAPCTAATAIYTVNVKGVPTASAGGSQTICRNSSAMVSGASSSNGTIAWTHNGAGSLTGAATLTPTYTPGSGDAGNTVTLTMTVSNAPCTAATATYTVNVTAIPTASAGGSQTICRNGTVTVSGASSSNGTISWTHNGAGSLSGGSTLTPTYTSVAGDAGNTVILTMTVSNSPCTAATATYTVNVKAAPTATAGGSQTICVSGTATVSGATSSNGTIAWTHNGAGSLANATSLTPTYTPAAGDAGNAVTLTMTVSNSPCTAASAIYTVNVTAGPTAVAGTPVTTCSGSGAVSITAGSSATNQSGVVWTTSGTGTFANATSLTLATYTPSSTDITAGSVTLTLTATGNGACSSTTAVSTKTLTITLVPTLVSTTPGTRCGAGTVVLGASYDVGTLDWYAGPSGGPSLGTGTNFTTPSISATTTYYVAASNSGCPSSRTAVVATVDNACAYTWTGTSSTVWNLGSNWSFGYVPTSINDVVIPSSVVSGNMPNITSSVVVKSLTNSGTVNVSSSGVLNVYGNLSNTGTVATVPGSTISMVGSSSQTISGLTSAHNLSINNNSGVSLSSSLSLKGSLLLVNGVFTTNGNLVLDFDSGGNIGYNASDAGSISGNVTGTRNLVNKTHYIASPFAGVTVSQIHATTPVYKNKSWLLATKNYGAQSWNYVKDSTTTVVGLGTGYSLAMYNSAPLTLTGTYSHTSSNYSSGSYTNTIPASMTKGMYFMMGNPYPSTLDWDNASGWTKTNINNAIYFWNPATSSVSSYVNGVGTNGATQYIPAMQSFLVTVTGTGGFSSLAVNNNARVLTNASYFRSSSQSLVRLSVKNATGSSVDETVVRMDDLSTADYDSDADAFKVSGLLSLYTKNVVTGPEYSINTLPISGPEMLVPLNLRVAANGLYTIECKEYSIPGYSMILEDKQTQSYTFMDNSTIYTLNATTKDSVNRFVLRFVAGITTGTTSGTGVDLQISTYENQAMLNVSGIHASNATINVYDASGLSVMRFDNQLIAPGIKTLGLPGLPSGVYIVKVEVDAAVYVGKVVLK